MNANSQDRSRARRRALIAVRWFSLAPLVALGLAWCLWPWLRERLNAGTLLLVHGDVAGLREWARELGPSAAVFTSLLMIVQALAAPIPAVLVTWTNSWLFGPFVGGCLSIVSATFAAALCFLLARALGAPLVDALVSRRARERADQFLERHGSTAILVARLLPFVPFDPISYVAGLSSLRLSTFVWATLVGQIPAGFAYSYLGQSIDQPAQLALLAATSVAALALLGWSVARALRSRA